MTDFHLLSDKQIIAKLGSRFDKKRIQKGFMDKEVMAKGGVSSDALNKFRSAKGGITLLNFIRLFRGIDELDKIETLLSVEKPLLFSDKTTDNKRKRIRQKTLPKKAFVWGNDQ